MGEVDYASAPVMGAALDGARLRAADDLLVDRSATTFVDGFGLSLPLEARRDRGGRLRLYQPPASLRRILRALELESTFTIVHATPRRPR